MSVLNESTQLILDKLQELISSAGGKITEFYPIALRQQYIESFSILIGTFLLGIFLPFIVKKVKEDADYIPLLISAGIITMLMLIVTAAVAIPQLLNPHFYAVQEVMYTLGILNP